MGGHVVFKHKEDEFEGVGVTNFRFMEEMLVVPRLRTNWKKG